MGPRQQRAWAVGQVPALSAQSKPVAPHARLVHDDLEPRIIGHVDFLFQLHNVPFPSFFPTANGDTRMAFPAIRA